MSCTQGGKGNKGMFFERTPKVRAAGLPTAQGKNHVADHLVHYLLQEEADALIKDAIIPVSKELRSPILPTHLDMRNAGVYTDVQKLLNPPSKTKFAEIVEELKNTTYSSYWKQEVGRRSDPLPLLPGGFDVQNRTTGKMTAYGESLYDLVMPKEPFKDKSSLSKRPGYQIDRKYVKPAFDPNYTFGIKYRPDKRGTYAKCCFSEDRFKLGKAEYTAISTIQADTKASRHAYLGSHQAPHDNISSVPKGYAFGEMKRPDSFPVCLTACEVNTGKQFFLKCLGHLNTVRRYLSKRFDGTFFKQFYMYFKYIDKDKTGWLPKQVVYNYCADKNIRFLPSLIEPLLEVWNGFDGSQIDYKVFVHVINYRVPSPALPKIPDIENECIEFSTTYGEMVRPGQELDKRHLAGLPSGRYFDKDDAVTPHGCCKAIRSYLPQESDARACLNPSQLTLFGVSHRDMYAKRSPEMIRQVFEAAGEIFTADKFNEILGEAKKYHSQGWLSFETFRKAMNKLLNDRK